MIDPQKLKLHANLFTRMGEKAGIDLQEEAISGHLHFDEIAEAVLRCTRCGQVDACKSFLENQKGDQEHGARETPPNYCRNLDLFDFLNVDKSGTPPQNYRDAP